MRPRLQNCSETTPIQPRRKPVRKNKPCTTTGHIANSHIPCLHQVHSWDTTPERVTNDHGCISRPVLQNEAKPKEARVSPMLCNLICCQTKQHCLPVLGSWAELTSDKTPFSLLSGASECLGGKQSHPFWRGSDFLLNFFEIFPSCRHGPKMQVLLAPRSNLSQVQLQNS